MQIKVCCNMVCGNYGCYLIQVNQKRHYRESDLLDVGFVVQKARKQGVQQCYSGV